MSKSDKIKTASMVRELSAAHKCSRIVSEATIRSARKKPAGVSDVRWRIELRRRASPEWYEACH